ncbi:MAG: phosphate ABC transporter substrate-binding protein PstS [Microcystaceae cyanobacterium]
MNRSTLFKTTLSMLALSTTLAACGPGEQTTTPPTNTSGTDGSSNQQAAMAPMERPESLSGSVTLNGAGASFPAPLYQNWFVTLAGQVPDLMVNYQSVGSGAGVEQFTQGTVDFGASDVAMTDEEMANISRGVLLLPMTAGSIVMAYNLPGVEGLKLTQEAQVGIFNGSITTWNDPMIADANPDVELPSTPITVVHRSDGSGTTGVFTMYLSAVSPEWESSIGQGKSVEWPTGKGKFIGAKGNEGITAQLQQTEGAIGYIEYGYARNNGLTMAALQNQSDNFITPNDESAAATLAAVELPENLRAFITDPEGDNSYPIVTYTWMLIYKDYDDPNKAIATEAMIQYGLNQGQQVSGQLGYVPLPQNVREKVAAAADEITPDFDITLK